MSDKQYDNTNTGLLARNDRRRNDKDPEYSGLMNVEGREYWLAAWVNTGKKGKLVGKKFFSIRIKPKNDPSSKPKQPKPAPEPDDSVPEDDVPF